MGESRSNPRSPQYRGPLPQAILGTDLRIVFEPNEAMRKQMAEMKEAGIDGPMQVHEKDMDAVMYAMSSWGVPHQIIQDVQTSTIPFAVLGRMPMVEFKKRHKENFERSNMKLSADTIVIPPDEPILT